MTGKVDGGGTWSQWFMEEATLTWREEQRLLTNWACFPSTGTPIKMTTEFILTPCNCLLVLIFVLDDSYTTFSEGGEEDGTLR
jgi:hypothetical protein